MTNNLITAKEDEFVVTFDYNPALVEAVKVIPGRKFHKANHQPPHWTVPGTSVSYMANFAARFGFAVTEQAKVLGKQMRTLLNLSTASEAELDVKGLHGELHPFQKAGVKYAMLSKRCFIGDEPGLGKTMQAIGLMQATKSFPALVTCPATVKIKWKRELNKWLPDRTVAIAEGDTLPEADIVVINWDIINRHVAKAEGTGKKGRKGGTHWEAKKYVVDRGFKLVVMDESHYAKNYKAMRTRAAHALSRVAPYRLLLTGTPIKNRNVEWLSQLMILDRLDEFGGFWTFVKRYCGAERTRFGWDFSKSTHSEELNERMKAVCYIRRLKKDVKKDLPPKTRTTIPVKLTNRKEYNEAANDLLTYLKHMAAQPEEIQRKMRAEQLSRIEITKQLAVKGKMEAFYEWVDSFLETGEKLVVFAHHRNIVKEVAEHYKAPMVIGGETPKQKQAAQDAFQQDPNCQLIVCSKAGTEGIDLFAGSNSVFLELWWTPGDHDQAEDRLHREGQHDPVTAWYFIGEDTVDEDIYELLQTKRATVQASVNGSKESIGESVVDELVKTLVSAGMVKETGTKHVELEEVPNKKKRATFEATNAVKTMEDYDERLELVKKQVLFLYACQTADEQATESTRNENASGFNMIDAAFGSSLARQIQGGHGLTMKQLTAAEKMLRKYRRQLDGINGRS